MAGTIFESMFQGSMCGLGPTVFSVWAYSITFVDKQSHSVVLNPTVLAPIIGTTEEDIKKAIGVLEAPDAKSRCQKNEGRRLVNTDGFHYFMPSLADYIAKMRGSKGKKAEILHGGEPIKPTNKVATNSKRVEENTPLMKRVGLWMSRRPDTLWSLEEAHSLLLIDPTPEDVEVLEQYYLYKHNPDKDYRRRTLQTLLNNWVSEVDKASMFIRAMPKKVQIL